MTAPRSPRRQTEPPADMLSVEEALQRVLALVDPLPAETRLLPEALGQVLADDVFAPFDVPPHDNTAMDGYAVLAASTAGASPDHPLRLRVMGELAAGYTWDGPAIARGQALRIMTGAPLPPGADAIVPFEETDEQGLRAPGQAHARADAVGILKPARPGANIRYRAEDQRAGARVLPAGTRLDAAHVAVCASLGLDRVRVIRRPRVAIVSTGDELLLPGQPPASGKIYDSNAYGLEAMVREFGGIPRRLGIARDTVAALTEKIREAVREADLVLTSAGVSRGDYDVVKEVLVHEGRVAFWTVRMKPGKPLAFGAFTAADGRRVPHLGLPGNPVSSLLVFELFGRPALHKMRGLPPSERPRVRAIADDPITNTDGRRVYARAIVTMREDGRWHARLTGPQGSGVLGSLAAANGLAICPESVAEIPPGAEVDVLMTAWGRDG